MHPLLPTLTNNLRDTVTLAIGHKPPAKALIVYDRKSPLAELVTEGYKAVLPDATLLDFDTTMPDLAREAMNACSPGDLVVLVQSGSFRLNEFRFRLELFNRKLAVIEHPHLGRIPEHEHATYVHAMAYDPAYYRTVGPKLKAALDNAKRVVVACEGTELTYEAPFESAKLNIGDYTGMKNVGGQFPIGEVFTEPSNLENVNGKVKLFAYGDTEFHVVLPKEPVTITIEKGKIVDTENAPPDFIAVLNEIREEEGLWVRELGLGLNRALTRTRTLVDIGSYERMCGVHMSMGAKHTIYAKPGFPKRSSHYHVDVFVDVTTVTIDDMVVFKDGTYLL